MPAEELVRLRQGGDYGWPACYYDQNQRRLVLAPEYGGDGGKTAGVCAQKLAPVAAFPGHWAPNDLLIYTGTQFPDTADAATGQPLPPEGIHADAGRTSASLPMPPGATREQLALGDRIFHGGGAPLSPPDVTAVAAYVWAVGHAAH